MWTLTIAYCSTLEDSTGEFFEKHIKKFFPGFYYIYIQNYNLT